MTAETRLVVGVVAVAALFAAPGLRADDAKTAERERICGEAVERYKELFGKAPEQEPVPIVMMYRYTFCPPRLEAKAGATVRFINVDKRTSHSVWFRDAGREESERLFPEESVEVRVDLPAGEHAYLCGPHWEKEGMTGRVSIAE